MIRNWRQDMPSVQAYWINRILYDVHHMEGHLKRYSDSPDTYMKHIPLPDDIKALIRDNEVGKMYLAGANPYLLRAHCLGVKIPEQVFLASLRAVEGETRSG